MNVRRVYSQVLKDLERKMVFVAGPRQVGKKTLAKAVLEEVPGNYYNWDHDEHRKLIKTRELSSEKRLWVFDEIHKYRF